jgi:Transport and Golgi organisation 2
MCTLSFYPKPDSDGFILTFSRDEMPNRSTVEIVNDAKRGLIYPKDALHGGTWFAIDQTNGRFTCLLNGAFEIHKRQLPYRKSRGLVLLESFEYTHIEVFWNTYDFTNIEPFTMISGEKNRFWEFRWDGNDRHARQLNNMKPEIWSSCTLYNQKVRNLREIWFSDFLNSQKEDLNTSHLWLFHQTPHEEEPENGILMRRPSGQPCTVSISQITYSFSPQIIDFQYYELGEHKISKHQFSYRKELMAV